MNLISTVLKQAKALTLMLLVNYLRASLSADKGRPKRHFLEKNVQFRDKPRSIKPFGGANKFTSLKYLSHFRR